VPAVLVMIPLASAGFTGVGVMLVGAVSCAAVELAALAAGDDGVDGTGLEHPAIANIPADINAAVARA